MRFLKTRWVVLTLLCRNHSIARAFLAVPTGRAIGASLPSIHSEIPVQATPRVSRGDVVFDRAPTSVSDRTYRSSTLLGATPIHAAELDEPEAIQDASSADNVGGGEQKLTGNVSTARPYEGVKASPPQPSMCNEELHSGAEVAQTESTEENSMGTDGFMENMMDNVGGVSPISRRADGQLEVDGQGLLNLVRDDGSRRPRASDHSVNDHLRDMHSPSTIGCCVFDYTSMNVICSVMTMPCLKW